MIRAKHQSRTEPWDPLQMKRDLEALTDEVQQRLGPIHFDLVEPVGGALIVDRRSRDAFAEYEGHQVALRRAWDAIEQALPQAAAAMNALVRWLPSDGHRRPRFELIPVAQPSAPKADTTTQTRPVVDEVWRGGGINVEQQRRIFAHEAEQKIDRVKLVVEQYRTYRDDARPKMKRALAVVRGMSDEDAERLRKLDAEALTAERVKAAEQRPEVVIDFGVEQQR